uniref:Glucose/Sorbosone dehydrogenase domain-containing protein n=1 Tax=Eucampia antarctica TaxID=49252 RepID=A0A7S2RK10_9STRA|mmetsp:Transcript_23296/g.22353  ORF Transcript_23296/g.22353 Transcript_23296/m.22353 type:complete len:539 (+) Transcript_23296:81-1697(+)
MKITIATLLTFFLNHVTTLVRAEECKPLPLEFSNTMGLMIEKIGSVTAINTDAFSYNMAVFDNFDGSMTFFLDQKNGVIYCFDSNDSTTSTIFDMNTSDIPAGLTLDWSLGSSGQTYKVKSMTQGMADDQVIVVFTSSTLPTGWTKADATLPAPGTYGQYMCGPDNTVWIPDIYRPGVIPDCFANGGGVPTFTGYDVFYKFNIVDGKLANPDPFFVHESAVLVGHLGSGIITLDDGRVLWSTGDCTVFGLDGHYAPQLNFETCGKILLLDPTSKGEYRVVAKGVRNSQQMRIFTKDKTLNSESPKSKSLKTKVPKSKAPKSDKRKLKKEKNKKDSTSMEYLAFMDIGGVTAEEVNAVSIDEILGSEIVNFGWGRNIHDGKAREGTFYVNPGNGGVLGIEPSCAANAPIGEHGYIQPWIQFGRTATDFYYAISSLAIPTAGNDKLKLLWSEFNTGQIMGTDEIFVDGAPPVTGYKIKIHNADAAGAYLENGLNDLVKEELGDVGYTSRGDPRLFHFPDGHAGVFIERTGIFYKLTEMAI